MKILFSGGIDNKPDGQCDDMTQYNINNIGIDSEQTEQTEYEAAPNAPRLHCKRNNSSYRIDGSLSCCCFPWIYGPQPTQCWSSVSITTPAKCQRVVMVLFTVYYRQSINILHWQSASEL